MKQGPTTLLEAIRYFSDEDVCIRAFSAMRWPDGVIPCPDCGCTEHYYLKPRRRWKCKACSRQFSIKVGTVMEDSPISLTKWLPAIWMITNAKNGCSSWELHRAIGVTQKTAWFMFHRIRLAMRQSSFDKLGSDDGSEVEADETFIGGKAEFMHKDRKKAKGFTKAPMSGKEVVLGILERDGRVRTFHVKNNRRNTLEPKIRANVEDGATIFTDAHQSYWKLEDWYDHSFVDHAVEYVEGQIHTNGLENYWSLLKRCIRGTYVQVTPPHLVAYLDEQAFRYNERRLKDGDRFQMVLTQTEGRRITYRQLTGKEDMAKA